MLIPKRLGCCLIRPMKNTISGNEGRGFMKLLVASESQRVVGLHLIGPECAEIIQVGIRCIGPLPKISAVPTSITEVHDRISGGLLSPACMHASRAAAQQGWCAAWVPCRHAQCTMHLLQDMGRGRFRRTVGLFVPHGSNDREDERDPAAAGTL